MVKDKYFYISSPIYYANASPHLGHIYSTLYADIIARFQKEKGKKVVFVTGCDQHGNKIWEAAAKTEASKNTSEDAKKVDITLEKVKRFVEKNTQEFINLWKKLNINYDHFVQTTSEQHQKFVLDHFEKFLENEKDSRSKPKRVEFGPYQAFYCLHCESFFAQRLLKSVDQKLLCPDCKRPVTSIEDACYKFITSPTETMDFVVSLILRFTKEHPRLDYLKWIKQWLTSLTASDNFSLPITRSHYYVKWGINLEPKFPNLKSERKQQRVFVWIDALLSYLSCLEPDLRKTIWEKTKTESIFKTNDHEIVHLLGKEISRFHLNNWPILLENLDDYRLPDKFIIHGWLMYKDQKISKSSLKSLFDFKPLLTEYGVDVFRLFFASLITPQEDVYFNPKSLHSFYNDFVVNDLSNYCFRLLSMIKKYQPKFTQIVKLKKQFIEYQQVFEKKLKEHIDLYESEFKVFSIRNVVKNIFSMLKYGNSLIEERKPWKLVKNKPDFLVFTLYQCLVIMKLVALFLKPITPTLSDKILSMLNLQKTLRLDSFDFGWDEDFALHQVDKLFEKTEQSRVYFY